MPELPEVETIRRGLQPALEGSVIHTVQLNRPNLRFPFDKDFAARLQNRRIIELTRRAKYLIANLDSGDVLAIHLGMTGRFTISYRHNMGPQEIAESNSPGAFYYDHDADPKHDHVIFTLTNGAHVAYNDVRRFGYMTLVAESELARHALFKNLGPEPLSETFNAKTLIDAADRKTQPLKAFLLDQSIVAGLGNIYVCEALFRSRLPPEAPAKILAESAAGRKAAERLSQNIKAILTAAIDAGGSTLRDYRHADGAKGSFQDNFAVYDREGKDCVNACGMQILRAKHQGRSSFFCPSCQSRPG